MNQTYDVVIVDDEPLARDIIEVFVQRVPDLNVVAMCANAMQALAAIQQLKPHLLFLDIQMPEMTGIDLLTIPVPTKPAIILTTAYPEYALKSYEFAVIDYLVKPIAFERFMQAIVKFKEKQIHLDRPVSWSTIEVPPGEAEGSLGPLTDTSVWLREEKRLLQIPYEDILYVEGLKDYVKVFLSHEMIMTHLSIGKAEDLFRPPLFVRIHRSHIVRLSAIRLIDGNNVRLINGVELQIGASYREELKRYISALR